MVDHKFIVENFYYRLGAMHSGIKQGWGNPRPSLVVVQDDTDYNSTRFVLKHMGLLDHTFVLPVEISDQLDKDQNEYYLRELVDILQPLLVVAAGSKSVIGLRDAKPRQFAMARYRGRPFSSSCLDRIVFPVYAPADYIRRDSDRHIRKNAKKDWYSIKDRLVSAKADQLADVWLTSVSETFSYAQKFFETSS